MISTCLFPYLTKSDSAQEVRQSANGKIYESILMKGRMEENGSATETAASSNPFKLDIFKRRTFNSFGHSPMVGSEVD